MTTSAHYPSQILVISLRKKRGERSRDTEIEIEIEIQIEGEGKDTEEREREKIEVGLRERPTPPITQAQRETYPPCRRSGSSLPFTACSTVTDPGSPSPSMLPLARCAERDGRGPMVVTTTYCCRSPLDDYHSLVIV